MNNPLIGMLENSPFQAMGQAMQMIGQIRNSGNVNAAMNTILQSNPNVKKAMDMCKGRNPKEVFENACRNAGYNPDQFTGIMK